MNRHIGRFSINAQFVHAYDSSVKRIFGMMTILDAKYLPWSDRYEYVAICDKFKKAMEGEIVPTYKILVEDGHPIFIATEMYGSDYTVSEAT